MNCSVLASCFLLQVTHLSPSDLAYNSTSSKSAYGPHNTHVGSCMDFHALNIMPQNTPMQTNE